MYAIMTSLVWRDEARPSPESIVAGILPTLQSIPGYEGFISLSDPEGGYVVGITLWENEEALAAAEPRLAKMRSAETRRGIESATTTTLRVVELDLKQRPGSSS